MQRNRAALLALFALAGCATTADDYGGSPAATKALAECRAQSNMAPGLANAQGNPMFAAAQQQQFVTDCMAARGFRAR